MDNKTYQLDQLTENDKNSILNEMKNEYTKEIEYMGADNEPGIFSWSNIHLNIYILKIHYRVVEGMSQLMIFGYENNDDNDNLIYIDLTENTTSHEFQDNIHNPKILIGTVIGKKLLEIIPNKIIGNSLGIFSIMSNMPMEYKTIRNFSRAFVNNEYKQINEHLSNSSIMNMNRQTFFANKYEFKKITDNVNNQQFTEELNQCLWAYEQEKWFVCAAGIGSVIEHLMLLTITNYSKKLLKDLGWNPTAKDYIEAFSKPPIKIDQRQAKYIHNLFENRNCINHYNSGYTNKGLVDAMLNGIKDIYNDNYIKSIEYKESESNNK